MRRMMKKNELRLEVMKSTGLTLVQFKKKYNGACLIVSSICEDLVKTYKTQLEFFQVDIENTPEIAEKYGIVEIPTVLFFRGGEIVDHITGLAPKNLLIAKIDKALSHT